RDVWHSNLERNKPSSVPAPRKIDRVSSGMMPRFIPPQLCKTASTAPSGRDWVHEVKFDGYRVQLRVEGGKATLRTRKALDWTAKSRATAEAASALPDCILDGEIVVIDAAGAPNFSALQAALSEGRSQDLVYFAFDLLFTGSEDWRARSLAQRKARLKAFLDQSLPASSTIRYVDHLTGSGEAVLRSACGMNLEGIVSKRLSAPYKSQRADAWVKSKCRPGHEVVIGGWSGSAASLRSLVAGVYRADHLVYVGQVGTGFN